MGLAFGGAEGGEVMLAHQRLRGGVHRLGIQFCATCQTWPASSAGGLRRLRMR